MQDPGINPSAQRTGIGRIEWITLLLISGCYALWTALLFVAYPAFPNLVVVLASLVIAFHGSLIHEVIHGHPFRNRHLNAALMRLPLNLAIPYCRFRDLHLAHHRDSNLTDPYDDPETNYLDPKVWDHLPGWKKALLRVNNTLAGRILIGPAIAQACFVQDDWHRVRRGERGVLLAWVLHFAGAAVVIWLVARSPMPVWAYLIAAYAALGLLRIRTFLEHQAHEKMRARSVIIEDRGPLAFLFLNNNFHVVHHMYPDVPWYRLPALYRAGRDRYLKINEGYVFRSYAEVFRKFLLKPKDPVAHPLWHQD